MMKYFLLTCLIFITSFTSIGQIVNIESQRLDEDSLGLNGLLKMDFYTVKNTSELYRFDGSSKFQYRKGKSIIMSINSITYNLSGGDELENEWFQHFRYNYLLNEMVTIEAFTQLQYNALLRIERRWLLGSGPKFKLIRNEKIAFHAGLLYMYEYENESNNNKYHRHHRMSDYLSLSANLTENFTLNHITYYQPRLDNFKDWRVSTNTNFTVGLFRNISFSTGVSITYDSEPVDDPNISNLSYRITNGIVVKI